MQCLAPRPSPGIVKQRFSSPSVSSKNVISISRSDDDRTDPLTIDILCISCNVFYPLSRYRNLSRLGINASDVRNEVTDSSRVSVLVVVLYVSTASQYTESNPHTQETSLTKLLLSEIPALASKTEDSVDPMKSVETTSSSV